MKKNPTDGEPEDGKPKKKYLKPTMTAYGNLMFLSKDIAEAATS
ncbi:MAG: hypothetical protein ACHQ2Z_00655 [Elusimicrobiota bacterium]